MGIKKIGSDLSITRKTEGKFVNVSPGVCFPKSRINENGGNGKMVLAFEGPNSFRVYNFSFSIL